MFAQKWTNLIFCPEDGNVTKSSLFFACKKNTFGSWSTLFQTIYENLHDETLPIEPMNYFFGRTDVKSIEKRLKSDGQYCLRYHDEGGLELCILKQKQGGTQIRKERIEKRKLKEKGVVWKWEETVARIGGSKVVTHYFGNVGEFLKELKDKKIIGEPVMFNSAYKTLQGSGKKVKGQNAAEEKIMEHLPK